MKINLKNNKQTDWQVKKIGVIGPGIVGMPMAAMLAHVKVKIGNSNPAKVVVIQRNSPTSGWKVAAINAGKSVIGGIEPKLDRLVAESVADGLLGASHDYASLTDADVILVCVQTDKQGFRPDYGPLFDSLKNLATALQNKPPEKKPLIIFESTLAPSTMATLITEHFARYGLLDGRDILLGNSPNRVMPGRLVERVMNSDKIVAGLRPETPALIQVLYSHIVTKGKLYPTNSLTAEIVKTLENAYRDVRIAYSAEIARYCDYHNIDFYQLRDQVNKRLAQVDTATNDPNAVPRGGILIPTIGVGGHCLPKDGILLWWRKIENRADTSHSLIMNARYINDESPSETLKLLEHYWGDITGKKNALLGAAYRFNSEDTRNSPTLVLANQLLEKKCSITIHDPYVKPDDQNLIKFNLHDYFTQDLDEAVSDAEFIIFCTAHRDYIEEKDRILQSATQTKGVVDGCNIFRQSDFNDSMVRYAGIGKGTKTPENDLVDFVYHGFRSVERGFANEINKLIEFFNQNYANGEFNIVNFEEVQQLAGSCSTGCEIVNPGEIEPIPSYNGFKPKLVEYAEKQSLSR